MNSVPPSRMALEESLTLSENILKNIELSEIPLANIALKTVRLARLLNDFETQTIMQHEVSGYPATPNGLAHEVFLQAEFAGRGYEEKSMPGSKPKKFVYCESIEQLEQAVDISNASLQAASDSDVTLSSANPHQFVAAPTGNWMERQQIRAALQQAVSRLSSRRAFIYQYALAKHYELKYSGIANDVFSRLRERVDRDIGKTVPDGINKLTAVYENLSSDNAEDWSNAVHSCRRLLQSLADAIYPARDDRTVVSEGMTKCIKLGTDNYINRIISFIDEHAASKRFSDVVGSHLEFIGNRLDSIFLAAQKGSHGTIVSQEEADRYVVYTYLVVGDVLSLLKG